MTETLSERLLNTQSGNQHSLHKTASKMLEIQAGINHGFCLNEFIPCLLFIGYPRRAYEMYFVNYVL